ncbi:hypothetical protein AB205_0172610 [Aquarana catesbeiana]|uniref:Uncharacterized protein n=1 Tax=Aquarana catesbeiana TaxID=8400 RepID=A0A2G9QAV3_AQUCT|nr:hypothetical protein AB205_0172610 [Aquarana catesbeiana]
MKAADDICVPRLWSYKSLHLLSDQTEPRAITLWSSFHASFHAVVVVVELWQEEEEDGPTQSRRYWNNAIPNSIWAPPLLPGWKSQVGHRKPKLPVEGRVEGRVERHSLTPVWSDRNRSLS